ncbi:MAG: cation transporter [Candidatus Eisenbacteria bacterium]|nr:cation transporter [Candidatus Eisenbacteria bacterium]
MHHADHAPIGRLRWVLFLTVGFLLVEVMGGVLSNSLALLSDAGHMLSDVSALTLALVAAVQMRRPPDVKRSFGYKRLEVIAALGNAMLLCGVAVIVGIRAHGRLQNPPEIRSGLMLAVAAAGLAINIVGLLLLHGPSRHNMGVRGAFLHIVGDTLGSLGAIAAGLVIQTTGWTQADAIASFLIAVLILASGAHLARESLHILIEGVPRHIDLPEVERSLRCVAGVAGLHDLHVWRIASGFDTLTVHIVLGRAEGWRELKEEIRAMLRDRFGIEHCTIEMEGIDHERGRECAGPVCEREER